MGSAFPSEPVDWFSDEDKKEMVTFCMTDPNMVIHRDNPKCHTEYPHAMKSCGIFIDTTSHLYGDY